MEFFETIHKMHCSNGQYIQHWRSKAKTTNDLKPYLDKKFKLRVYNFNFYDLSYVIYQNHLFLSTEYCSKIDDNIITFEESKKIKFRITYMKELYQFSIYHIYQTEDYTVLYSTPDARTIAQSYRNDPEMAHYLLSRLCPCGNTRNKIIDSAFLVDEAFKKMELKDKSY